MSRLGLTIRMGAEGFNLSGPEGRTDLRPLARPQLSTLGQMVSEAMGLDQLRGPGPSRQHRRRRHRNPNRKG